MLPIWRSPDAVIYIITVMYNSHIFWCCRIYYCDLTSITVLFKLSLQVNYLLCEDFQCILQELRTATLIGVGHLYTWSGGGYKSVIDYIVANWKNGKINTIY